MRLVSLQGKLFNIMMPALYVLFQKPERVEIDIDIDIYLATIGLTPGGSIIRHIYKQIIHKIHCEGKLGSAGRAPSCRVIPWHLPYD